VSYARHPRYHKTILAIIGQYFWPGMKKYVADFIARCMECQKVKDKHIHLVGFLQPFPIPKWKWEVVTTNFITRFPKITREYYAIMVFMERLTMVAHFTAVNVSFKPMK
jgi:hypothetical protein